MLYSTNLIEDWDGEYQWMVTLGNQLELEDWTLQPDLSNKVGDPFFVLNDGLTAFSTAKYNPSDKWEFIGRLGYERFKPLDEISGSLIPDFPVTNSWTFGAAAHWFPLRDSQDLRLHAAIAGNTSNFGSDRSGLLSLTLGAMYYLRLPRNR